MRIAIDPNIRAANNETYSCFKDLFGDVEDLKPGDQVTVMCEETDVIGDAKVSRIDPESRLIYLAVDWNSLRQDVAPSLVGLVTITSDGKTKTMSLGELSNYDWADDDSMSPEETMRRFNALGPVLTTGPDPSSSSI